MGGARSRQSAAGPWEPTAASGRTHASAGPRASEANTPGDGARGRPPGRAANRVAAVEWAPRTSRILIRAGTPARGRWRPRRCKGIRSRSRLGIPARPCATCWPPISWVREPSPWHGLQSEVVRRAAGCRSGPCGPPWTWSRRARAAVGGRQPLLELLALLECQLGSLVAHAPREVDVTMTVYFSREDARTERLLEIAAAERSGRLELARSQGALFRRSIGATSGAERPRTGSGSPTATCCSATAASTVLGGRCRDGGIRSCSQP